MTDRIMNPKKSFVVNGEKWALHKSATDSTIPFAIERVKVSDFACEQFADSSYIVLVGGVIEPMPNTLEKPVKIMMIGFAPMQVAPAHIGNNQLRNMHVYKTDPKSMANEFAKAFFNDADGEPMVEQVEITPFPKKVEEVKDDVTTTE